MKKLISQLTIAAALTASLAGSTATPANADNCDSGVLMFFGMNAAQPVILNLGAACSTTSTGDLTYVYPNGATVASARLLVGTPSTAYGWLIYQGTESFVRGQGEAFVSSTTTYTVPVKQTQRIQKTAGSPVATGGGSAVNTPRVTLDPTKASASTVFKLGSADQGRVTYNSFPT